MKKRNFLLGASIALNTYLALELQKHKTAEKEEIKKTANKINLEEKIKKMKAELELIFAEHEKDN